MKERVQLAAERLAVATEQNEVLKQRIKVLEKENDDLRASIPQQTAELISDDTRRVLVHLFRTTILEDRDVGTMARALGMEISILKYHLDRLNENNFAACTGGNYVDGHVYWALSPEGRRYAVERKLP
jgi:DNA-binding transcriptional ArsR family regulator